MSERKFLKVRFQSDIGISKPSHGPSDLSRNDGVPDDRRAQLILNIPSPDADYNGGVMVQLSYPLLRKLVREHRKLRNADPLFGMGRADVLMMVPLPEQPKPSQSGLARPVDKTTPGGLILPLD